MFSLESHRYGIRQFVRLQQALHGNLVPVDVMSRSLLLSFQEWHKTRSYKPSDGKIKRLRQRLLSLDFVVFFCSLLDVV